MANMSYCRFENTSADLADCVNAPSDMNDNGGVDNYGCGLNQYEESAAKRMRNLCDEYIELYDNYIQLKQNNA